MKRKKTKLEKRPLYIGILFFLVFFLLIRGIGGIIVGLLAFAVSYFLSGNRIYAKINKELKQRYSLRNQNYDTSNIALTAISISKTNIESLLSHYIVLDTETTGLSPTSDEIIQLSFIEVENGQIVRQYNTLVNPLCLIPPSATAINGIAIFDVLDAPTIEEIAEDVFTSIKDLPVVGHNITFDLKFLAVAFARAGYSATLHYFDTLNFARNVLEKDVDVVNHKLPTLAAYFNISYHAHDALSDVMATNEVLKKCYNLKYQQPTKISIKPKPEEKTGKETQVEPQEKSMEEKNTKSKINTTDDEIAAFYIVRGILADLISASDLAYKDTESYFGILYQNNTRKPICRVQFGQKKSYLLIPDENKKFEKYPIDTVSDINNFKEQLITSATRYLNE